MENYIHKICPYCQGEINEGDAVKVCPACDIPHHQECWDENKGCTTFGCAERCDGSSGSVPVDTTQQNEEQTTNSVGACRNCGTVLTDEQDFCPQCDALKSGADKSFCGNCGTELHPEQEFCPQCGQKINFALDENVADAINAFNAGVQKKTKRKKRLVIILVIVFSVLAILVAVCGLGYFYLNDKYETIVGEFKTSKPSSTVIASEYDALGVVGQHLFREEIVDAFVDHVSDNPYEVNSDMVNETALEEYALYKKIADTLDISSEDNTNVVAYIDAVLTLESYVKYNDLDHCVSASIDSYMTSLEYLTDAIDSSVYLMTLYIGYANTHAQSALFAAQSRDSGDALCAKYIDALETFQTEINDLYSDDGYYSAANVSKAFDAIRDTIDILAKAEKSVESIVDELPVIY